jgi:hypothetical protein
MATRQDNTLLVEGAEIRWKNFSGEAGMYNTAGQRNFCLFLPEETALQVQADGWPVKALEPRDEGDETRYFVRVKVKMDGKNPPTVVMISHRGRTTMDEDTVGLLDHVWIKNVDLVVRPYQWEFGDKSGTNVYLNAIYVTLEENEKEILLEERYSEIPEVDLSDQAEAEPEEAPF